jgi:16S rRNA (uracil1498-N3)-methyltransferase
MTASVHLVPSLDGVAIGDAVVVEGPEAHHAVAVRRLRRGELVDLTDGRGVRVRGTVVAADKRCLQVAVAAVTREPRSRVTVTVVQAIPKGERAERAVELLTEIGADVIVPWRAARCVAVWREERVTRALERWRSTANAAAKQSRRSWFPEVAEPVTTPEAVALVEAAEVAVVAHESGPLQVGAVGLPEPCGLVVVVGPEGGLTDDEVTAFATVGARIVRLGPEILRTSTAGVATLAALLARSSRWDLSRR